MKFTALGVLWALTLVTYVVCVPDDEESTFWLDDFEDWFETLLENQEYDGGTVGVMKNGRLVFARGYGNLLDRNLRASSLLPTSSLSKTITAVAIMQLVERGEIGLRDTVFGQVGILHTMRPMDKTQVDPRLKDITVEHLLRHSGGWDSGRPPIFDPMLNQVYLNRGYEQVVDIAKEVGIEGWLSQYDIIRYMMSQPLDFTPGTKSKLSNLGYCILGRIIEEVTELPYEVFVKDNILSPTGMFHTRIGPRLDDEYRMMAAHYDKAAEDIDSQYIHSIITPEMLDSTLGWYSNVYDLSRFMTCLIGNNGLCRLLFPESLQYLLSQPSIPGTEHGDGWRAIGFHVTGTGALWQDSELHDNDVVVYHQGPVTNNFFLSKQFSSWPDGYFPAAESENVTIIALMASNRYKKLRSSMRRFVSMVLSWPPDMHDVATVDLSDSNLVVGGKNVLLKYNLDEHHLVAYCNALKIDGYNPTWIHAYTDLGATYFLVISEKATNTEDLDFKVLLASSTKKLYTKGAEFENTGYQVSMAQSFKSMSHDTLAAHFIVLRKSTTYKSWDFVQWALNQELDSYLLDLEVATSRGYSVAAQSVERHGHKTFVSYVFQMIPADEANYVSYHEISLEQLEWMVKSNAMEQYHLEYLDSYKDEKEPRFSAVFRKSHINKWLLQTDIDDLELAEQTVVWSEKGYVPKIICGYEKGAIMRFVGLWVLP